MRVIAFFHGTIPSGSKVALRRSVRSIKPHDNILF
jgi:hypothetical protein